MPAKTGPSEPLGDEQQKELVSSLLIAFPDIDDLRDMLHDELDINLNMISGTSESVETIALNLIHWSEAQGMTARLVAAVRNHTARKPVSS
jgi:hypothetical protein